jgi:hypothetical protein
MPPNGVRFTGDVSSFSHIWLKKQRYGAASTTRGQSAKYAYIDTRIPVEIQYIFRATQEHPTLGESELLAEFAVVRRFQRDDELPNFPWALWYVAFLPRLSVHIKLVI